MPDIMKEIFAKNLNYFMNRAGTSQADICKALGVSSATVSDWCQGNKYPRTDKIQRLADLLGVRFSNLTTERGIDDYEDDARLEALHQNPRLGLLFDRSRKMTHEDVEFMLQMADRILKERDGE
jgi:transcriptional regulator with XRE-family HTH domain